MQSQQQINNEEENKLITAMLEQKNVKQIVQMINTKVEAETKQFKEEHQDRMKETDNKIAKFAVLHHLRTQIEAKQTDQAKRKKANIALDKIEKKITKSLQKDANAAARVIKAVPLKSKEKKLLLLPLDRAVKDLKRKKDPKERNEALREVARQVQISQMKVDIALQAKAYAYNSVAAARSRGDQQAKFKTQAQRNLNELNTAITELRESTGKSGPLEQTDALKILQEKVSKIGELGTSSTKNTIKDTIKEFKVALQTEIATMHERKPDVAKLAREISEPILQYGESAEGKALKAAAQKHFDSMSNQAREGQRVSTASKPAQETAAMPQATNAKPQATVTATAGSSSTPAFRTMPPVPNKPLPATPSRVPAGERQDSMQRLSSAVNPQRQPAPAGTQTNKPTAANDQVRQESVQSHTRRNAR